MNSRALKRCVLIIMTGLFLSPCFAEDATQTGVEQMTNIERLPILRPDVQVHYEGSMDKTGRNRDWDWWLYQEADTKEWVLMEADGPGCLWNFVVHHAVGHSDPVYRFYFDGSKTPSFEIKQSEFGSKYPFVTPLAGKLLPDVSRDARLKALDFQINRSFCPMPFAKSMKITSSVKLEGDHRTGGGWGHAIWHSYPTANSMQTFTGKEDYSKLLDQWKHCGQDPKPSVGNQSFPFSETIAGKTTQTIFAGKKMGSISSINLKLEPMNRTFLNQVWIRITWDGEESPAVEAPIGAFFGNELGYNRIQTLMQGTQNDGQMYCYWPMPFWKSAKIELEYRGTDKSSIKATGTVMFKPSSVLSYSQDKTGHFRASYQEMVPKLTNSDSHVATIRGNGHMVAGLISSKESMCEGDVRIHLDGSGTPGIESDGSESWANYGWGFEFPPQANPGSSYDGTGNKEWSMLRLLVGDFYPFRTQLRMTVEGGLGDREGNDLRSGIIFWYGETEPAMVLTDFIDVGDSSAEKDHDYKAPASTSWKLTSSLEGEFNNVMITDSGKTIAKSSEFTVKIAAANQGVILRRRSDQAKLSQHASVFVDGQRVRERKWLCPDRNSYFRWLDDEFFIPLSYTKGKQEIRIRIEPLSQTGRSQWNESMYWVWSLGSPKILKSPTIKIPTKALPPFEVKDATAASKED